MTKQSLTSRVITLEVTGFTIILLLTWVNEFLDLPALLGAVPTPVNWIESLLESSLTLLFGVVVISLTWRSLRRLKYLEGFLVICAFCKRVQISGQWVPIEIFINGRSEASLSHGYCPDCTKKHYGEIFKEDP